MFISLISRIIGLLRDTLIANSFGTTYQAASYVMSLQIPNILFGIIGVAITTAFIPILSETNKKSGKEEMYMFANSIMNLLLIFSVIPFVLGFLFTPTLVNILAPNFQGRSRDLTIILTKLSVINLLFLGLNRGYTAILQSMNEFSAPALVGIVMNIPIISLLFKHGVFDQMSVGMTSKALLFLTIGMAFWGVRDVFNRAFYAIQDTKTPMKNGALGVIFNIGLSIVLVRFMGIGGLTLATSLSAMFFSNAII